MWHLALHAAAMQHGKQRGRICIWDDSFSQLPRHASRYAMREQCAIPYDGCHVIGAVALSLSIFPSSPSFPRARKTAGRHTHGLESHTPQTVPNTPSCATSGHQRQTVLAFMDCRCCLFTRPAPSPFTSFCSPNPSPLSRILASVSPSLSGAGVESPGCRHRPRFGPGQPATLPQRLIASRAMHRLVLAYQPRPPVCHGRMHVTDLGSGLWDSPMPGVFGRPSDGFPCSLR